MTDTLPSPLDLEVQEFCDYSLIIDARSPKEFANDHIPNAVNLPVLFDDQVAKVGTLHKVEQHRAHLVGVALALRNMALAIEQTMGSLPTNAVVLVYCLRGGTRSRLWFDTLRIIGYRVKVLTGGWKAYRRWVRASLETLPGQFSYRLLSGPEAGGKTQLFSALHALGAQVLDLQALAQHRDSSTVDMPGASPPSQMLFESQLLATLRQFDCAKPIWVLAQGKKLGTVRLPASLLAAMQSSPIYRVEAPVAQGTGCRQNEDLSGQAVRLESLDSPSLQRVAQQLIECP